MSQISKAFNHGAFIEAAEALNQASVDRLADFYSEDCVFSDPFQTVTGQKEVRRVYASMFEHLHGPRFHGVRIISGKDSSPVVVQWTFDFALKAGSPPVSIPGMSVLELSAEGKIARHTDFWDASLLMQAFPVLGPVLRWARKKIAAA